MDKRRHLRIEVPNLIADVSDGTGFFTGTVGDISRFGVLLDDIPKKFNDQSATLSIVISGNSKSFKIQGKSKWVNEGNLRKKMGIQILDSPSSWTAFVKRFEPKDDDIWATVTH